MRPPRTPSCGVDANSHHLCPLAILRRCQSVAQRAARDAFEHPGRRVAAWPEFRPGRAQMSITNFYHKCR
eukprot:6183102-Prymnesium_polylepis.1